MHVARLNKTGSTDDPIITIVCPVCFNIFTYQVCGRHRKYCSKACSRNAARKSNHVPFDLSVICVICGHVFQQARSIGSHAKYCSERCRRLGNRDSQKQYVHRRRAKSHHVGSELIKSSDIFERDHWVCRLCGKPVDKLSAWPSDGAATLDHIRPLSRGGTHTRVNVQLAHWKCNRDKRDSQVNDRVYAVLARG